MVPNLNNIERRLDRELVNTYKVGDILLVKWSARLLILDSSGVYLLSDGNTHYTGETSDVTVGYLELENIYYDEKVLDLGEHQISI